MNLLLLLLSVVVVLQSVALLFLLREWLYGDLSAQRRGRRAACAALAEISVKFPEAAVFAKDALKVASLPGDAGYSDLLLEP